MTKQKNCGHRALANWTPDQEYLAKKNQVENPRRKATKQECVDENEYHVLIGYLIYFKQRRAKTRMV